jgi:hypothetical protein
VNLVSFSPQLLSVTFLQTRKPFVLMHVRLSSFQFRFNFYLKRQVILLCEVSMMFLGLSTCQRTCEIRLTLAACGTCLLGSGSLL